MVYICAHATTRLEVRGQLGESSSVLLYGFWGVNSGH